MDYDEMRAFQLGEEGHDEPRPLVFDADYLAENCQTEEDFEAIELAMDRDMGERLRYWERRAKDAEEELARQDND